MLKLSKNTPEDPPDYPEIPYAQTYAFYMCFICFYKFSTEELGLATGALRRLSLAKIEAFVVSYRKNREGTVHYFY